MFVLFYEKKNCIYSLTQFRLLFRVFRRLRKLKKLNLSFNNLDHISSQFFTQLKNLKILNLRGNKLGKLPIDAFEGMNHIQEVKNDIYTYLSCPLV